MFLRSRVRLKRRQGWIRLHLGGLLDTLIVYHDLYVLVIRGP